jgi:two-component system, OmpR family, copper resistance phosphate regulon response regulator CusR
MATKIEIPRVLIIEDEEKLAYSIARQLASHGYEASVALDGVEGLARVLGDHWAIVILDLNLPKKSGMMILRKLRAEGRTTPLLILSARGGTEDRVKGLRAGADDYLAKPFDSGELLARMEAILRRSGDTNHTVLNAADLTLDLINRTVRRGDRELPLSPKEFALLEFFIRNKNHILTRRRIAESVWGYKFDTGTNIVDVYVAYLRKAIGENGLGKLIHTVPGQGYILKDKK